MFGLKKKEQTGTSLTLAINGMHCTSCSMTIDDTLEEIDGVLKSRTNYAKSVTEVEFDPARVTAEKMQAAIAGLGYSASVKQ